MIWTCARCGAELAPSGHCSRRAHGCQGGAGEASIDTTPGHVIDQAAIDEDDTKHLPPWEMATIHIRGVEAERDKAMAEIARMRREVAKAANTDGTTDLRWFLATTVLGIPNKGDVWGEVRRISQGEDGE